MQSNLFIYFNKISFKFLYMFFGRHCPTVPSRNALLHIRLPKSWLRCCRTAQYSLFECYSDGRYREVLMYRFRHIIHSLKLVSRFTSVNDRARYCSECNLSGERYRLVNPHRGRV